MRATCSLINPTSACFAPRCIHTNGYRVIFFPVCSWKKYSRAYSLNSGNTNLKNINSNEVVTNSLASYTSFPNTLDSWVFFANRFALRYRGQVGMCRTSWKMYCAISFLVVSSSRLTPLECKEHDGGEYDRRLGCDCHSLDHVERRAHTAVSC